METEYFRETYRSTDERRQHVVKIVQTSRVFEEIRNLLVNRRDQCEIYVVCGTHSNSREFDAKSEPGETHILRTLLLVPFYDFSIARVTMCEIPVASI